MNITKLSTIIATKAWGGKMATVFGRPSVVYRPRGSGDPIVPGHVVLTPMVAIDSVNTFKFTTPQSFGKPTFFAAFDARLARIGDYLVQDQDIYFLVTIDDIAPPQLTRCNRRVTLLRTLNTPKAGLMPYGGTTAGNEAPRFMCWPASVLEKSKGDRGDMGLPGDKKFGNVEMILPVSLPDVPRTSDIITDDLSRRFVVTSAEQTFMGWRVLAQQVAA